jgi:hypothetical protein
MLDLKRAWLVIDVAPALRVEVSRCAFDRGAGGGEPYAPLQLVRLPPLSLLSRTAWGCCNTLCRSGRLAVSRLHCVACFRAQ